MVEDKLYPILFEGKFWEECEVNSLFSAYYHSRESLSWDKSVYIGDGISIYPNGVWKQ